MNVRCRYLLWSAASRYRCSAEVILALWFRCRSARLGRLGTFLQNEQGTLKHTRTRPCHILNSYPQGWQRLVMCFSSWRVKLRNVCEEMAKAAARLGGLFFSSSGSQRSDRRTLMALATLAVRRWTFSLVVLELAHSQGSDSWHDKHISSYLIGSVSQSTFKAGEKPLMPTAISFQCTTHMHKVEYQIKVQGSEV